MSTVSAQGRVLDLLAQALTIPDDARAGFLDQLDGEDVALRAELESLLVADQRAAGFLEPTQTKDRAGELIGAWRLERLIGRGGMGEVWLARRSDGLYQANVAIKFLLTGTDIEAGRFARERRVLAELVHPNIARLVDAGHDDRGVPWVAMDFIDGQLLDAWCHTRALPMRGRVQLLLKIVEAVAFAHARLIVHRDLKPANILVDGAGEPHLLDFGIAKLLDETEPGLTVTGVAPMTPDYASPEQLTGNQVGVASDIWSLGAIAHELLVGALPFAAGSRRLGSQTRTVGLPSRVAATHGRRLPSDLDHVLLKALATRPADRYQDCGAFGADLRRFLAGRPVYARAAGRGYRAWKFITRHRWGVAIGVVVVVALLASATVSLLQARGAREQATLAAEARERSEHLNEFLLELLASPEPARDGRDVTVAELLDRAADGLEKRFDDQPAPRAEMHKTLARSYHGLGLSEPAQHQIERAIELLEGSPPPVPASLVSARVLAAHMLSDRGRYADARNELERARQVIVDGEDELAAQLENLLGTTSANLQDFVAAQRHYQRSLAVLRRMQPPPTEGLAVVLNNLGTQAYMANDGAAAITYREEALRLLRAAFPDPHPQTLLILENYADDLETAGHWPEAERTRREVVAYSRALNGPAHPRTLNAQSGLALSLMEQGLLVEAERIARDTLTAAQAQESVSERAAGIAAIALIEALAELGRGSEALALVPTARRLRKSIYPDNHPALHEIDRAEGLARIAAGDREGGLEQLRQFVAALEAGWGSDHPFGRRGRVLLDRAVGGWPATAPPASDKNAH